MLRRRAIYYGIQITHSEVRKGVTNYVVCCLISNGKTNEEVVRSFYVDFFSFQEAKLLGVAVSAKNTKGGPPQSFCFITFVKSKRFWKSIFICFICNQPESLKDCTRYLHFYGWRSATHSISTFLTGYLVLG